MHYFATGRGPEVSARHCVAILAISLLIIWPAISGAQTPTEAFGVDSNGNSLVGLDFETGIGDIVNSDGGDYEKLRSLETVANICASRLDVVVADPNGGSIRRYQQGSDTADLELCSASDPDCPQEPTGLSLSIGAVLGAVDNGYRLETESGWHETTAVWVFPTLDCPADGYGDAVLIDTDVCLPGDASGCREVHRVVDTEFIDSPREGFNPGDLLVLTSNPDAILRYPASEIACRIDDSCPGPVEPDVIFRFNDGLLRAPTGLASLPEEKELLMALKAGRILAFRLEDGEAVRLDSPFATHLGLGTAGIDAGVFDETEIAVVAQRFFGKFLRFEVGRDPHTGDPFGVLAGVVDTHVFSPRDAAVNANLVDAEDCADNSEDLGCLIGDGASRIFYNGQDEVEGNVLGDAQLIFDPRSLSDIRDLPYSEIGLPGGLVIPSTVLGFPLDDGRRVLILIDVQKFFDLEPAAWVEFEEGAANLIQEASDCRLTGNRLYYHPGVDIRVRPDLERYHDISIICENPSRGLGRDNSPVVFGSSTFVERLNAGENITDPPYQADVKAEATSRLNDLLLVTLRARGFPLGDPLRGDLLTLINQARSSLASDLFADASGFCDAGAVLLADNRGSLSVPTEIGDILGRLLNCAFFIEEEIRGNVYVPPDIGLGFQ